MKYFGTLFDGRKRDAAKLKAYGFAQCGGGHSYSATLQDGGFEISVTVPKDGPPDITVVDSDSGEEYGPAYVENVAGNLAGKVRKECERLLADIAEKCFVPDAFKSEYAQKAIRHIKEKFGDDPEYLWKKFPNNAIFRERKSAKWYAALLTVQKRKVGLDEDGDVEIIDLKAAPETIEGLVDGKNYLPGYHMNKKHWFTIRLDGSVPFKEICGRIGESFKTLGKG